MKFFPALAVLFLIAAFGIIRINAGCVDEDHIYECRAPDEEAEDITCTECFRDGEDGHYNCSCWANPHEVIEDDETVYRTCQDAFMQGETENGTYTLKPDNLPSFKAYCDMETSGGGWTVIQRRMNGSVDFYQGWAEYIHGFGDVNSDYWLGLSKIHRLTNNSMQQQLWVDLESYAYGNRYALYNSFSIDGPSTDYTLRLSGYSGNAGNAMGYNNGRKFSTKDHDNDAASSLNCASYRHSGWWHGYCTNANLNGFYHNRRVSTTDAIYWNNFDSTRSLKYSSMMIRANND